MSFFEQGTKNKKGPTLSKQVGDRGGRKKRNNGRNSPTRSSGVAVPGETGDLRVAATAEALAADGRYAGFISRLAR